MSEIVQCTAREPANQLGRSSTPVRFIISFFKFAILFFATYLFVLLRESIKINVLLVFLVSFIRPPLLLPELLYLQIKTVINAFVRNNALFRSLSVSESASDLELPLNTE